ncbi:arylsulfatase [Pseudomaricurvus alkylphenolicus]|uniref:arylsulfatase n=1 Tax=Pseudomaricurvus alkylphenolicus TaxID=1306991 RepID=UPI0014224DD2|nr:arylsulfatase [Pseudomaricurvus alkylphenolicus]NIB38284.1 arylsulfatase [Pseudomaricurvus alkylphenolicus]
MTKAVFFLLNFVIALSAIPVSQASTSPNDSPNPTRPNILLIVADDLGYADLGSYGSEIETPNLDKLANAGVKFTNLYAAPTCSPTRAMLLSGTDNHIAGLGNMAEEMASNQQGRPGYEGYLNFNVVSVASLLRDSGYRTYMSGKWHLGLEQQHSPFARGFDRSYTLLQGGGGHFDDLPIIGPERALYREDGKLTKPPKDFYSTEFYVDKLISYLQNDRPQATNPSGRQPFFAYLAFTAPHWPLQAPAASIEKYRGRYDRGYDHVLEKRLNRMRKLGLIDSTLSAGPRFPGERPWEQLTREEQKMEARKMEIFAAMVDDLDHHVGRLLDYLEQIGEKDNTFIFFLSDNGAEGHHLERGWKDLDDWVAQCCNNSYDNMGEADSYVWYGPNWGRVSSGPLTYFKGFTSEGGVRVPGFVHYPVAKRTGEVSNALVTVKDFVPTVLELTGADYPKGSYRGHKIVPLQGTSMLPYLNKQAEEVHDAEYAMGWELFGKRAVRQGDWKIVWQYKPYGTGLWALYNLNNDPSESRNLANLYPEKLREMIEQWDIYARDNNVILPDHANVHY